MTLCWEGSDSPELSFPAFIILQFWFAQLQNLALEFESFIQFVSSPKTTAHTMEKIFIQLYSKKCLLLPSLVIAICLSNVFSLHHGTEDKDLFTVL